MQKNKISRRIGVLSDTHMDDFNDALLYLNEVIFKDADIVIHCGDVVRENVLNAFYDKDIYAVSGNMDRPELKRKIPNFRKLVFNGVRICALHSDGYGKSFYKDLPLEFPDTDIFLYGHTHKPEIKRLGNHYFFNPGSFSFNRLDYPSRSAGLIDLYDNLEFSISLIDLEEIENRKFKLSEVIHVKNS